MSNGEQPPPPRRNGRSWVDGRCQRGHDVTDPANLRVYRRKDGRLQRLCRTCNNGSRIAHRAGQAWTPVPMQRTDGRVCGRCGHLLERRDNEQSSGWRRRRYCDQYCFHHRRVPPLPDRELAALRALVGISTNSRETTVSRVTQEKGNPVIELIPGGGTEIEEADEILRKAGGGKK